MKLTWLGHAACHIQAAGKDILIDPFFTGNPKFPAGYEDKLEKVDAIVLTHGHEDHLGDTVRLAKRFDAVVVAQFEICAFVSAQGAAKIEPMNTGGSVVREGVRYTMVPAFHSSAVIQDGKPVTMGDPAGYVIEAEGVSVYHAGDTSLFSDMALIQRLYRPKVGLLPIGDRFTMGPEAAAIACNEFLDLEVVIPIHWGTFDLLTGDPETCKNLVQRGEVRVLAPGEWNELGAR